MLQSVKEHNHDIDLYYLLSDEIDNKELIETDGIFELFLAKDIGIPNYEKISFAYDIVEFNTAVKPFYIKYLFDIGYKKVIYLDPDILVCNSLDIALEALENHSIVVTPHMLAPDSDVDKFSPYLLWEQASLQTGIFNLGFIGVSNTDDGREFIRWWSNRCSYYCFDSRQGGLFVDQKWANLIVCFFDSFYVLKHKGYNMAIWNLNDRVLVNETVNGDVPLVFYHFSAIDIDDDSIISKWGKRMKLKNRPDLKNLFDRYRTEVLNNGYEKFRNQPYTYGYYKDGRKISLFDRRLYLAVADDYLNPFELSGWHFYKMLKKHRRMNNRSVDKQNKGFLGEAIIFSQEKISRILEPLLFFRLKKIYGKSTFIPHSVFL